MAWEWELRDTCQTSVRYAALGDSMLSWSAADGAPTGAADLGEGVGEFWALLLRRGALTRPGGERGLDAKIGVLPFHDYKRLQMASPGAMAIPYRPR